MDAPANTPHSLDHWVIAWCSMTRQARTWQDRLETALQPHRLVIAELLVLWRTGGSKPPGISQIDLARELNISAAQVCGIVAGLQKRSWLQTHRPAEDRRRLYCSLTELGKTSLGGLIDELAPLAEICLQDTPPCWSNPGPAQFEKEAA